MLAQMCELLLDLLERLEAEDVAAAAEVLENVVRSGLEAMPER
jgi:hypothetical protein